jgi:predicted transcriptional regulator
MEGPSSTRRGRGRGGSTGSGSNSTRANSTHANSTGSNSRRSRSGGSTDNRSNSEGPAHSGPNNASPAGDGAARWITVSDPKAAKFLSSPEKAYFLYPFIGQERSVADVAKHYSLATNTVLYRVQTLVRLGLIRQTRIESRRGRPVRYYRAVADALFVPLKRTQLHDLAAMIDAWSQSLQPLYAESIARTLLDRGGDWGVRISREGNGQLLVAPAQRPDYFYDYFNEDAPAILEGWFDFWLDPADAKALQQDLMALYFKYYGRKGATRYLLRAGLTPLPKGVLPPTF